MRIALLLIINFIISLCIIKFIIGKLSKIIINKIVVNNINVNELEKKQNKYNNIVIFLNTFLLLSIYVINFKSSTLFIIIAIINFIDIIFLCIITRLQSNFK